MELGYCVLFENIVGLYRNYDAFLIDVYGVLWDGGNFFEGALELLETIKKSGRSVIILSNTTLTLDKCREKYQPKGLYKGQHFDVFVSAGEAFKHTLMQHIGGARAYFSAFTRNADMFKDSQLTEVDRIELADFVYGGNVNATRIYFADALEDIRGNTIPIEELLSFDYHNISGFDEISATLDLCLKYNKPLVIVNPDIFALEAPSSKVNGNPNQLPRPILCQGAIGELYENAGGKVIYYGKPHQAIYDYAKQFVPEGAKTVMIGDTLWTDILGGNVAGFDTILTLSGVVGKFIEKYNSFSIDEAIREILLNVSPKLTHKNFKGISQVPTRIVRKFA